MKKMVPAFVEAFAATDPKLVEMVGELREYVMTPGALDAKTKTLIAMALDAAYGAADGVGSLANAARKLGATEAEITEVLRIVYYIAGMGAMSAGSHAFLKKE